MFGLATKEDMLGLTAEVRALGKQLVPAIEPTKVIGVKVWYDRGGKRVFEGMYTGKISIQHYASMSGRGFILCDEYGVQMAEHKGEVFYEVVEPQSPTDSETPDESMLAWQNHVADQLSTIELRISQQRALEDMKEELDGLRHRVEMLELHSWADKNVVAQPVGGEPEPKPMTAAHKRIIRNAKAKKAKKAK